MSHFRSDLRADLRAALEASARFAGFETLRAIPSNVDPGNFPYFVVRTPVARHQFAARDTVARETEIMISIRRRGGDDLEDDLDLDADAVEAAVFPVLEASSSQINYSLSRAEFDIVVAGDKREGRLNMVFSVQRYTDETYT